MQRETKRSGIARSVSLKGVRKAATSLKKATVDIVDKVGDRVSDIGHTDLDINERTATAMAISGMSIKVGSLNDGIMHRLCSIAYAAEDLWTSP